MSVAIVGGGISGLSCARRLAELGVKEVVVFDTGKRAVGGRSSSRALGEVIVDHVCQCFTAQSDRFKSIVDEWQKAGVVRPWGLGICGTLKSGEFRADQEVRYIGVQGMASLPAYLAQGLDVR
jgi:predicted NAD/FAD-dependent oxidoreductase